MKAESLSKRQTNDICEPSRHSEIRSVILWVGFILIFFGLQALLWVSALSLAKRYPIRPAPPNTLLKTKDAEANPKISEMGKEAKDQASQNEIESSRKSKGNAK